ncbi:hypothetical protein G6F56_007347 [Rhizopus delemar]|nr:hypothetical protein G6F56_007347 [Rhizopus delemar]
MSNINDLTSEQTKELLDLSRRLKDKELRDEAPSHFDLPEEIHDELENSSKIELKNKLKKFARKSTKFEGGKWTQSGTINKTHPLEIETVYTVRERSNNNCRRINQFVQCNHFKMEGVPALRELIEPNDHLCKIDLKDAYIVVPIHPESRKYLSFKHQDTIYKYRSLAFGLSVAPRVFSKLMRFALESIRAKGDPPGILLGRHMCIDKDKGGNEDMFQRSPETVDFLGIHYQLSKERSDSETYSRIPRVYLQHEDYEDQPMIPAMGEALLHIRYLQRDLAKSLRLQQYDWEMPYNLSSKTWNELKWWEINAENLNGLPIPKMEDTRPPAVVIHVDASDSGWGITSSEMETNGFWTEIEKETSFNVREIQTILFALQLHAKRFKNSMIHIFSDNITALKYAKKSGGTASPILQELALEIQEITTAHKLTIHYQHISGVKNVRADQLSRKARLLYEWKLPIVFGHSLYLCLLYSTSAKGHVKLYMGILGAHEGGCLRNAREHQTETILELTARSPSGSDRCISINMAQDRLISTPSMEDDSEGDQETQRGQDQISSTYYAQLANPILVAHDITTEHQVTNAIPDQQTMVFDRLAIIRAHERLPIGIMIFNGNDGCYGVVRNNLRLIL